MKKPVKKVYILFIVIVLLIITAFFLGFIIQWLINKKIDETKGTSGKVGTVLLNPLQGIYTVQNIDLAFTSAAVDIPVMKVKRVSVNINWEQLLSGKIVGQFYINDIEIRQIIKLTNKESPDPQGPSLTRVFKNFIPIKIDNIRLVNGVLVIRDESGDVPFSIDFTDLRGQISNLTNSSNLSDSLYANVKMRGIIKGTGALNLNMTFNPVAKNLQFHLLMEINDIQLTKFNNYISELTGVSFEEGTLSIYTNINADQGAIRGSVQSTYENMTILDPKADHNFLKQLRDAVAGLFGEIVEDSENKIVTRVPVNIKVSGTRPDVLLSVMDAIQKTLVRAFIPVVSGVMGEVE